MAKRYSYVLPPHRVDYGVDVVLADLKIDPHAQRSLDPRRAQKIADEMIVEALGSLYRNAGAANTAVAIAWEQFRRQALRLCGMRGERKNAAEIAAMLQRRFPGLDDGLEAELTACEEAATTDGVHPKEALRLVQTLAAHLDKLKAAAMPRASSGTSQANKADSTLQERAS